MVNMPTACIERRGLGSSADHAAALGRSVRRVLLLVVVFVVLVLDELVGDRRGPLVALDRELLGFGRQTR